MKQILIVLSLVILTFLYSCGIDKLSFTQNEIELFNKYSTILFDSINKSQKIEKYGSYIIKDKSVLDSILLRNKIDSIASLKNYTIKKDLIKYNLNYKRGRKIQIDPYYYYEHSIVFANEQKAGKAILTKTIDGKKVEEIIYLIDNGKVNSRWTDQWYEIDMIYSEKLDDNLFYIILEESVD